MRYSSFLSHNSFSGEKSSFLHFKKGDLIILEDCTGREIETNGWCNGYCERTRLRGDFPSEHVYVLPTLEKPQKDVLVCFPFQFIWSAPYSSYLTSKGPSQSCIKMSTKTLNLMNVSSHFQKSKKKEV